MTTPISIETANKMLTLVEPITADIKRTWKLASANFEDLQQIFESDTEQTEGLTTAVETMRKHTKSICHNLDELEELDCILESMELGVVDFPSELDGVETMLCWKLGEIEIRHHHKRGDNFERRSLIDQVLE